MIKVSVIIVNWNSIQFLKTLIRTMSEHFLQCYDYEIIIVDNCSNDGSREYLSQPNRHVKVILNSDNIGFTRAVNQASQIAKGEYIFLLNPDIEFVNSSWDDLIKFADNHPEVGAIGPYITNPNGSLQISAFQEFTIPDILAETLFVTKIFPKNCLLNRHDVYPDKLKPIKIVGWITGAAMLIRHKLFKSIGMMDENIFMYLDDADICRRVRMAGMQNIYYQSCSLIHHEKGNGRFFSDRYFSTFKIRATVISYLYYWRKHFGVQLLPQLQFILIIRSVLRIMLWMFVNVMYLGEPMQNRKMLKRVKGYSQCLSLLCNRCA